MKKGKGHQRPPTRGFRNSSWLWGHLSGPRWTRIQKLLSKILLRSHKTKVLLPILCFLSRRQELPLSWSTSEVSEKREENTWELSLAGALSNTEDMMAFTIAATLAMKASDCKIMPVLAKPGTMAMSFRMLVTLARAGHQR